MITKTDKQRAREYYQKCCEKYGKDEMLNFVGTEKQFYESIWTKVPKQLLNFDIQSYFDLTEDWQKDC